VLADLSADGQTAVLAKGGQGGLGNIHFKSSTNRSRAIHASTSGESRRLKLELKVLADVGLLGMPNAEIDLHTLRFRGTAEGRGLPFTTLHPISVSCAWMKTAVSSSRHTRPDRGAPKEQALATIPAPSPANRCCCTSSIWRPSTGRQPGARRHAIVEELRKYDESLFHKPRWLD